MLLSKNVFFLILVFIVAGLFIIPKIIWLSGTKRAQGVVWFEGHTLELQGGISKHAVILFIVNKDSFEFNGSSHLKVGKSVPILYQSNNPEDAIVEDPQAFWMGNFAYILLPLLVLLVLYFTPQRFDPLIPKGARIRIGKKPFVQIIHPGNGHH
jgi:hypothetical protein